jgi:hypothetical protein
MQEVSDMAKTQAAELRERWIQRDQEEIENVPFTIRNRLKAYCVNLIEQICINKGIIAVITVGVIGGGAVYVWLKWYN